VGSNPTLSAKKDKCMASVPGRARKITLHSNLIEAP